jgi:hypothetical protein
VGAPEHASCPTAQRLHVQIFVSSSDEEMNRNNLADAEAIAALGAHGINKI